MTDTNPSSETLAGADGNVPAADGGETVGADTALAELNKILGGTFKDLPTALNAVKETKSFVGQRREDIKAEVLKEIAPAPVSDTAKFEDSVKSLENRLFYSENPQYKGYENLIESMGGDPAKVVATDTFKQVFDKVQVADDVERKQSVVHSSPRIAQFKSATDEAITIANSTNSSPEAVAAALARGLTEALEG
jgi:hypothetical protein